MTTKTFDVSAVYRSPVAGLWWGAIKRENHGHTRAADNAKGPIKTWQHEKVYPYEGMPRSALEEVQRQVFELVTHTVNQYLPTFPTGDAKTKKLQLQLLRLVIEHAPGDLYKTLGQIIEFPQEKRQELASLLDRTTLSHRISVSKIITDRLSVLKDIETLLLKENYKLHERSQLHRMMADNAWIFGEDYHLSVDDQLLTEALKQHLTGVPIVIDEPVKRMNGKQDIVDLMFSRTIQPAGSHTPEHLIVELKRPGVIINAEVINQIEKYAFAVADDERFCTVPAKWVFWVVSNELDQETQWKVSQYGRPQGMLYQGVDPQITIWVKTWSQIINNCKSRLRFFEEKLNVAPDCDGSLEQLKATYHAYVGDLFASSSEMKHEKIAQH